MQSVSANLYQCPSIGCVDSGENLDESRLSGAVVTKQRVDAATLDVEPDVVECLLAREGLGNISDPNGYLPIARIRGVPDWRSVRTLHEISALSVEIPD